MSCKVTVDGPCRRTLAFRIERQVMERELEAQVAEVARSSRFKGFRQGKVPLGLVKKAHGKALAEDVRRHVMGRAFAEAVREHALHPVGEPEMNLDVLNDDGDSDFTFEFAIEVAPDFELDVGDTIPVTIALPPVDDAMIEREVRRLREQRATLKDAPPDAVIEDDAILEGTAVYVVAGSELEGRPERPVFLRHELVDGVTLAGSRASFLGRRVGDVVELELELPAHFDPAEHAGQQASLRYSIGRHRVMKVPALDEAFLAQVGVESVDEMRTRLRQALEAQRLEMRERLVDREIERRLLDGHQFELPERLTAKTIDRRVHEVAHQLMEQQGLSSEEGHERAHARREEIAAASRDGMRLAFIRDRIAREQGLGASLADAEVQVRALAAQQKQDAEATLASARSEGWLHEIQDELTHEQARQWLRGRAIVTETTQDGQQHEHDTEAQAPAEGT